MASSYLVADSAEKYFSSQQGQTLGWWEQTFVNNYEQLLSFFEIPDNICIVITKEHNYMLRQMYVAK